MIILPAIDLIDGQAVRLTQGDYGSQKNYGDPLELALSYVENGATHLHVVDLDAAKSGETKATTRTILQSIIKETELRIEIGGGIRDQSSIEQWLSLGVWRCILGTAAIRNPQFARDMVEQFGEQVIVGIDAKSGQVASDGWTKVADLSAVDFAKQLHEFGYKSCIYTDIAKDGMLAGANFESSVALAKTSGLTVIVSGGVKDIVDVKQALQYQEEGIAGIIAGKSLVEGTLDLGKAIELVKQTTAKE